jgi:hypothetical protein
VNSPLLALALALNRYWIAILIVAILGVGALCGVVWWTVAMIFAIALVLTVRWVYRPWPPSAKP